MMLAVPVTTQRSVNSIDTFAPLALPTLNLANASQKISPNFYSAIPPVATVLSLVSMPTPNCPVLITIYNVSFPMSAFKTFFRFDMVNHPRALTGLAPDEAAV